MKVFITGGTGFIGSHIRNEMLRRGASVTIGTRRIDKGLLDIVGLSQIELDFNQMQDVELWKPVIRGFDVVINCVGLISQTSKNTFDTIHHRVPVALFEACVSEKTQRVIQISALGADAHCQTEYHKTKKRADDYLGNTRLNWTIFYPSIVYGSGDQSMTLFSALSALPFSVIIDRGGQLIQPVRVEDVAKAVGIAIFAKKAIRKRVATTGAQAISFRELLVLLRNRIGLGRLITVSIPVRLAFFMAKMMQYIPGSLLSPDTVTMLAQGNSAPTKSFQKYFGFEAIGIRDYLQLQKASQAERWNAGLYFFPALLRMAIAAVWFFSGIVSLCFATERSMEILSMAGFSHDYAVYSLYLGSLVDMAMAFLVMSKWRPRLLSFVQTSIIMVYMLIVSIYIPQFWLDPFGSILKNIPLLVAIWICGILDRK